MREKQRNYAQIKGRERGRGREKLPYLVDGSAFTVTKSESS